MQVHEEGTVDVECLDDLTYGNVEHTALLELDTRFTELPMRYAPVRFRALKPIIQDLFDNVQVNFGIYGTLISLHFSRNVHVPDVCMAVALSLR